VQLEHPKVGDDLRPQVPDEVEGDGPPALRAVADLGFDELFGRAVEAQPGEHESPGVSAGMLAVAHMRSSKSQLPKVQKVPKVLVRGYKFSGWPKGKCRK
jgi:hypothetical protein